MLKTSEGSSTSHMNPLFINALKLARRLYFRKRHLAHVPHRAPAMDMKQASDILNKLIASDQPYMIARLGSVELETIACYLAHRDGLDIASYIRGESDYDRWEQMIHWLCVHTGFFPEEKSMSARYCELMMKLAAEVDVLGSWLTYEKLLYPENQPVKVPLLMLEPYLNADTPWTRHLSGKRVLVIHPFTDSITQQYQHKRELLFNDPRILPEFELLTLKAVQSIGGEGAAGYTDWFAALESMKQSMDSISYDVCLIGCGSYGFPLAAHAKSRGKQAIHLGGSLQLLFGIKGKRWTEQYGTAAHNPYYELFNEHWIFPADAERPDGATRVENACYW